jgi:hypothetical protein
MGQRTRQIYQTDLLYVGPTGSNSATGKHFSLAPFFGITGTFTSLNAPAGRSTAEIVSGDNLIAELYRVQSVNWTANKNLTDVNQFGELSAIDRIPLQPPTVTISFDYLVANLINESLIGLNVSSVGSAAAGISCISGLLAGTQSPKNIFIKTVAEGSDAADNNSLSYNILAFGNAFLSSYSSQASVGNFPTASVSFDALNLNGDSIGGSTSGVVIPAVNPTDGTAITGFYYNLPSGLTSYNDAGLSANQGISVLRPGDITLSLGVNDAGDTFFNPTDIKLQSYNFSFNFNQEDLNQLGSKYAYAKVPRFPLLATLQVEAIAGDFVTGKLTEIVGNNSNFNPTITMRKPSDPNTIIARLQIKNAKLDAQSSSLAIGSNKTFSMTFNAQAGGPQDLTKGIFLSGITVNATL